MKKVILSLMAVMMGMSMQAQTVRVYDTKTSKTEPVAAYENTKKNPVKVQMGTEKSGNKTVSVVKIYKNGTNTATYTNSSDHNYRLVLDDTPAAVSGTAKATINGEEVDVDWVQLWKGGPKFATMDVGAEYPMCIGNFYEFEDVPVAAWGSNWKIVRDDDYFKLIESDKVTRSFVSEDDEYYFFKFTGTEEGYQNNSIYLTASWKGDIYGPTNGYTQYWTLDSDDFKTSYSMKYVRCDEGEDYYSVSTDDVFEYRSFVRMVLDE